MFNSKILFLISCLIAVATAQKNLEGKERENALMFLKRALEKLPSAGGPNLGIGTITSFTGDRYGGDTQYYITGWFSQHHKQIDCKLVLWLYHSDTEDTLTLECPREHSHTYKVGKL